MKKLIRLLFAGILAMGCWNQAAAQAPTIYVCDGTEACLTVSTFRGTIQWQSSPDSLTWSNIPSATTDTFCFFPSVAGYYRAEVVEGTCAPVYSEVQYLDLYSVNADAGPDGTGCLGMAFMVGGSPTASGGFGPYTYNWTSNGSSVGTSANPSLNLNNANNEFVVEVTDSLGCMAYDTVTVSGYSVIADAGPDTSGCGGGMIMVGGSPSASGGVGPYSYDWYQGGSLIDTTSNPMVPVGPGPNNYILIVTDSMGCMGTDTVRVDTGGNATSGSLNFAFTGNAQMFVVPPCVFQIQATCRGAQGGSNWVNNDNFGGEYVGTIPVTPGETLWVYVGGQSTTLTGGFNGGGGGEGAGKGGGGGTDIRRAGNTLNDRVLVAGGGGGAGYWSNLHVVGGKGGGQNGGNGYRDAPGTPGGLGATQMGPGANGTCVSLNNPAMAGFFGLGGSSSGCGCEGYGGGGGWYGGAASGNCRGGGGGSGYAAPGVTNTSFATGVKTGNGEAIIAW